MALTLRQRDFLDTLVDLYRDARQPVHYSVLARTLGVSRFSAYDMLRLLVDKGLVRAEYIREEGGPGRPSVVFVPLVRAREMLARLVPGAPDQHEWAETAERILGRLEAAEEARFAAAPVADAPAAADTDGSLLDELLAAIPKAISPLAYSAQVLTALLLPIRSRLSALDRDLAAMLGPEEDGEGAGGGLDLLAGFALGASLTSATSRLGRDATARLVDYSRTCQGHIAQMDAGSRRALSGFVRQVIASMERPSDTIRS